MAKKGRTKVIYKGTFICIQTLVHMTQTFIADSTIKP